MAKTFVLIGTRGKWGRGQSLREAANQYQQQGGPASDNVVAALVIGDKDASVEQDNYTIKCMPGAKIYCLGGGFLVESLIKLV